MDGAILGGIGSVLAILGSAYAVFVGRKKVVAEAESVQVATSDKLVNMVMRQLAYMEDQVGKLQADLSQYRQQVERLAENELQLHRRISILETYIQNHGLKLPELS